MDQLNEFIPVGRPEINKQDIHAVTDVLKSGWIGTGTLVSEFETAFRDFVGAKYAVAVSSCTAALFLCLQDAGIGPGDEVLVPAITFVATTNAVLHVGATPILVDVKDSTMNLDVEKARNLITPKTKAIIPVHLGGLMCDMQAIMKLAKEKNLVVIEDAAHAIGAKQNSIAAGLHGDYGCFSFYPTKNLTCGEGGMIVSNCKDLSRVRIMSNHGLSKNAIERFNQGNNQYVAISLGYKMNMTDIQAALGLSQLNRISEMQESRQAVWESYMDMLTDMPVCLPKKVPNGDSHGYHLFSIRVNAQCRNRLMSFLNSHQVGTGIHYVSIANHPYHQQRLNISHDTLCVASKISQETVSLPLYSSMNRSDVCKVVDTIKRFFDE